MLVVGNAATKSTSWAPAAGQVRPVEWIQSGLSIPGGLTATGPGVAEAA
jgi:hypothetical protein